MKFLLFLILFASNLYVFGQSSQEQMQKEFENFKKTQNQSFDDFKNKRNKEFGDFLKKEWEAFQVESGVKFPISPIPPVQPKVIPDAPVQPYADKLPLIDLPVSKDPIDKSPVVIKPAGDFASYIDLSFYGNALSIGYDPAFIMPCSQFDEAGISQYWKKMSDKNMEPFINQINLISKSLQLNDWAKYLLVKQLSENFFKDYNDQIAFQFFVLNQLDYNIKVGRSNEGLILLMPFKNIVYELSFTSINGNYYYIIGKGDIKNIFSFKEDLSKSSAKIDLNLNKAPKFENGTVDKNISLKSQNKLMSIKYDKNLMRFYQDMPLTELSVFFNSQVAENTQNSLKYEFKSLLNGKNELEAANILLEFVQHGFEYKTDDEQFGREKTFFAEEIFHYPYSDCEDRSVLFAYLTRSLLNLDVIALNYPNHVATAVCFKGNVNGDFVIHENKKYVVCDPTYIGSSAGMAMPVFKNARPKVISIK